MIPKLTAKGLILSLIILTNCTYSQLTDVKDDFSKYYVDLPFEMPLLQTPKFPEKDFLVTNYGAIGDGLFKNTEAIQKAIDACTNAGGGRVVIPRGIWITGPIIIKNNVNLHLELGALLQFSKDFKDYPVINAIYEGTMQLRCQSPISARNANNIAITGDGVIDGGGDAWRYVKKFKLTALQWKALVSSGGVVDKSGNNWWPSQSALDASIYIDEMTKKNQKPDYELVRNSPEYLRPVMVNLISSKNILLDGPTFQNSPAWNIHPVMCENMIVRNITVRNPWYSQNGDGIDLESCKNVIVYNSRFDVGDDALCMKSGKNEEGRERGIPTENIIIADCIVYHGHGGFVIGSEMSGGVRNIKVSNCQFIGTDIGLRFKSTRGRGGIVENIYIDNIFMKDISTEAIGFNMFYGGFAPKEDKSADDNSKTAQAVPVSEETPQFKNIFMNQVLCIGAENGLILQGLPEMSIKGIELKNSIITANIGVSIYDAENIKIENTKIISNSGIPFNITNSKNVVFDTVESGDNETFFSIEGSKSSDIIIKGEGAEKLGSKVKFGNGASQNSIKIIK